MAGNPVYVAARQQSRVIRRSPRALWGLEPAASKLSPGSIPCCAIYARDDGTNLRVSGVSTLARALGCRLKHGCVAAKAAQGQCHLLAEAK
jgi:hypothetical protein